MLARLQRLLVFGVLGSALSWVVTFHLFGHPEWAFLGGLMILTGHAWLLGLECVLASLVPQPAGSIPRPRVAAVIRAWSAEVAEVARVFFWRQPFRSHDEPDQVPAESKGRHGVVFVHGFVCNRGLWRPLLRKLRSMSVPFIAVDLEPVFGSMDAYLPTIESAVARMEAATGNPVVLVGHSMGGLAIRAWLSRYQADGRARRVITIGSPHRGTWLARHGRTTNARQMRLANPWLIRLAAGEPASRYAKFSCFFGNCDNIVFPAVCATLEGARNLHLPATAHVHMAFHPQVMAELERWVGPTEQAIDPETDVGLPQA